MPALLVLLTVLATYRLTRLVTADSISLPLRIRLESRPFIGALVSCSWCLSVWLSPVVAAVAVLWPENRAVWVVLLALSASAVTGMLARFFD